MKVVDSIADWLKTSSPARLVLLLNAFEHPEHPGVLGIEAGQRSQRSPKPAPEHSMPTPQPDRYIQQISVGTGHRRPRAAHRDQFDCQTTCLVNKSAARVVADPAITAKGQAAISAPREIKARFA